MTDPDAAKNEPQDVPPQQPPRPQRSQIEEDERYARQLAEQYDNVGAYEARTSNRGGNVRARAQPGYDEERERNFIDDDLPAIRENLRQGFIETQTKVNGWISTIKKKIEENFDESEDAEHREGPQYRHGGPSSRSTDYDADPQVLSDDFAGMKFAPDGSKYRDVTLITTQRLTIAPYSPCLRQPTDGQHRRLQTTSLNLTATRGPKSGVQG
jgi:hypothetical protein